MNLKKILYHYCSIETFKLILENKTIRFSSLGKVDDLEEALTSDFDDFGRVCFVSCWTDLEQESIEMWRSYTQGLPGVRIGLPEDFFAMERSKCQRRTIPRSAAAQSVLPPPNPAATGIFLVMRIRMPFFMP